MAQEFAFDIISGVIKLRPSHPARQNYKKFAKLMGSNPALPANNLLFFVHGHVHTYKSDSYRKS